MPTIWAASSISSRSGFPRSLPAQASGEVAVVGATDVEVKVGGFRMRLGQSRVELQKRGEQVAVQIRSGGKQPRPPSPGMELDLRGMTVDEIARLTGENARTLFAADRKEPNRATR